MIASDTVSRQMLARIAVAFCAASRWITVPSLVLSGLAFIFMERFARAGTADVALAMAALSGAVQAYLAFRIELDRIVFAAFGENVAAGAEDADAFDNAMVALGLLPQGRAGRGFVDRVRGLVRLVKVAAVVFAAQLAAVAGALWMRT